MLKLLILYWRWSTHIHTHHMKMTLGKKWNKEEKRNFDYCSISKDSAHLSCRRGRESAREIQFLQMECVEEKWWWGKCRAYNNICERRN